MERGATSKLLRLLHSVYTSPGVRVQAGAAAAAQEETSLSQGGEQIPRAAEDSVASVSLPPSESQVSTISPWEEAYARFETPEQERRKFVGRLRRLGAPAWTSDAQIVELFCGRGNGMQALAELGFTRVEGVDLSPTLIAQYQGTARTYVADCRALPFADESRDILIVQGGLHHLESLPADLEQTLSEARRVLRPGGRFVAVEPWATPFLSLVHTISSIPLACRLSNKIDAFATMTRYELRTYEQWLDAGRSILQILDSNFSRERCWTGWGKLMFVGTTRTTAGRS
jgi:ubiquinone/menaquinone biosynthesis C-methylase UbiE